MMFKGFELKHMKKHFNFGITATMAATLAALVACSSGESPTSDSVDSEPSKYQKQTQGSIQDSIGGVPDEILSLQSNESIDPPPLESAIDLALQAAKSEADSLIDRHFHTGSQLLVPEQFETIQGAIDAAASGDTVVVSPGVYYELLVMKDGVKLVSDSADGGDELVSVEGSYILLPKRTVRTVIDGSKAEPSEHGMIDFDAGVGRNTMVDGFTIQNLPKQDHHIPGHAHALNVRGASPVITNCYLINNGSTGIGNHVVYYDQENEVSERDFRWANIEHSAEAIIYNNVVSSNLGLGIGCNHFSKPYILGNEVLLNNDSDLGEEPAPGIGAKHGAAPLIMGNIIHDNPGGGILSKVGEPQGVYNIDRPTHPTVENNVAFNNGEIRPAISSNGGGSMETPVKVLDNFVYDSGRVGIALSNGAFGIVEDNLVSKSAAPGVSIKNSTALKLNRNKVTGAGAPGFVIRDNASVLEMIGNAAESNDGPRFMLLDSEIAEPNA